MQKFYAAFIEKENDTYGASFPDFPGCVTAADSEDNLFRMIEEATSLHVEGMVEDGDEIPEPMKFEDLIKHEFYSAETWVVYVPIRIPTKSRRRQVMLPDHLVDQIDGLTNNRSAFIVQAIKDKLKGV